MNPQQAEAYVDAAAAAIDLPIPADCKGGVVVGLQRIAAVAEKVTSFTLATDIEAAPVFRHAKR
jgi:hypothetical protein